MSAAAAVPPPSGAQASTSWYPEQRVAADELTRAFGPLPVGVTLITFYWVTPSATSLAEQSTGRIDAELLRRLRGGEGANLAVDRFVLRCVKSKAADEAWRVAMANILYFNRSGGGDTTTLTVLVIDEAHYGSAEKSILHKKLEPLLAATDPLPRLRIVCVTATPYNLILPESGRPLRRKDVLGHSDPHAHRPNATTTNVVAWRGGAAYVGLEQFAQNEVDLLSPDATRRVRTSRGEIPTAAATATSLPPPPSPVWLVDWRIRSLEDESDNESEGSGSEASVDTMNERGIAAAGRPAASNAHRPHLPPLQQFDGLISALAPHEPHRCPLMSCSMVCSDRDHLLAHMVTRHMNQRSSLPESRDTLIRVVRTFLSTFDAGAEGANAAGKPSRSAAATTTRVVASEEVKLAVAPAGKTPLQRFQEACAGKGASDPIVCPLCSKLIKGKPSLTRHTVGYIGAHSG